MFKHTSQEPKKTKDWNTKRERSKREFDMVMTGQLRTFAIFIVEVILTEHRGRCLAFCRLSPSPSLLSLVLKSDGASAQAPISPEYPHTIWYSSYCNGMCRLISSPRLFSLAYKSRGDASSLNRHKTSSALVTYGGKGGQRENSWAAELDILWVIWRVSTWMSEVWQNFLYLLSVYLYTGWANC